MNLSLHRGLARALSASLALLAGWAGPRLNAQSLPYASFFQLQEAADALSTVEGMWGRVTLTHRRTDDARPFQVFLETPAGREEIKVETNGAFRLPKLAREKWEEARLVHNLEKGALSLNYLFGFQGPVPSSESTLGEFCRTLAARMGRVVVRTFGAVPELADLPIGMVGVAIRREEPGQGRVLLKRGDQVVAEGDLSKTGVIEWLFDQYDPKDHRVVWEGEEEDGSQVFEVIIKSGPEVLKARNTILIPRTAQELAALGPVEPGQPPVKSGEVLLAGEQLNLFPETNMVYRLQMPPMLYRPGMPGPKEEKTSRGWEVANEFVFRTGLRLQVTLPAQWAMPHRGGVLAGFRVQDSDRMVRVYVRGDLRTVEYRP